MITEGLSHECGRSIRIAITVDSTADAPPQHRLAPAPSAQHAAPVPLAPPYGELRRDYDSYGRPMDDEPTMRRAYPDYPPGRDPANEWPRPAPQDPYGAMQDHGFGDRDPYQPVPRKDYGKPDDYGKPAYGHQQPQGYPPPRHHERPGGGVRPGDPHLSGTDGGPGPLTARPAPASGPGEPTARLNPKYLFDTFVIGASNRFAHAAAVAVAEAPAKAYNPLFIYGESGLGKTHLLHAIGHYARSLYPGTRVRYVSSEEFTNEFINSIRDGKADTFRKRYRDMDILLVDDIQFLASKESTQEEFFHTFNTLHNANKQIVLSSDRPPKQLVTLEDRLRNRFEWGLITDVQPPELETRIAILRKKAVQEQLNAPPEVLEFIASRISRNIRELEGALIRVTAFASLNRQPVDLQLTEIVLKDLIPGGEDALPEITGNAIMAADRRLLRPDRRGPVRLLAQPGAGDRPADRHVPVPGADRPVAAQDRRAVRRPRPHHGDARGPQDPRADGRAALHLQPGHRAHQPHQELSRAPPHPRRAPLPHSSEGPAQAPQTHPALSAPRRFEPPGRFSSVRLRRSDTRPPQNPADPAVHSLGRTKLSRSSPQAARPYSHLTRSRACGIVANLPPQTVDN